MMTSTPRWVAPVALWGGVIASAVVIGLYAEQPLLTGVPRGTLVLPRVSPVPTDVRTLLFLLGVGSTFWYVAAVATPLLIWAARRLEFDRARARVGIAGAAVMVTLILITAAIDFWVVYGKMAYRPRVIPALIGTARQNALPWIAVAGLVLAVEGRRRAIRSSFERERFRAEVAEQRVIALTSQLQPHFLFNTLQGISTLIHRDPVAADAMLVKLSDLLRDLLRHRDRVLVPLGEELQYIKTYLEISKIRFGDRLEFEIDVPHDLRHTAVPLFVLQPLIENALRHGIGSRITGGRITITAARRGDRVRLEVIDDGPLHQSLEGRGGIGLSNTRERLEAAFGARHGFSLLPRDTGGAIARVEVPAQAIPTPS
jgi:two-component system, LytTR family, sensor kinase